MISGLFDLLLASILTTSYQFRRGRTLTVRKLKKLDVRLAYAVRPRMAVRGCMVAGPLPLPLHRTHGSNPRRGSSLWSSCCCSCYSDNACHSPWSPLAEKFQIMSYYSIFYYSCLCVRCVIVLSVMRIECFMA